MPFGPYKSFSDCTRRNSDKADPAAYCATIERAITKRVGICKIDEPKQQVFGWSTIAALEGEAVVDLQDDIIPPAVLEDAVYDFVLNSRESGEMHVGKAQGRIIESVVFTPEKLSAMGFPDTIQGFTGHWLGIQFDDEEVFKRCRSGEYTAFSIQGTATV